jgi:hypothetical protein
LIQLNALIPCNFHDKIRRIKPVQLSVWNLKSEGVLCPGGIRNSNLL